MHEQYYWSPAIKEWLELEKSRKGMPRKPPNIPTKKLLTINDFPKVDESKSKRSKKRKK